jgi:hypothetical protein
MAIMAQISGSAAISPCSSWDKACKSARFLFDYSIAKLVGKSINWFAFSWLLENLITYFFLNTSYFTTININCPTAMSAMSDRTTHFAHAV